MSGKRKQLDTLYYQMDQEASSYKSHWRECADYNLPRRARFTVSDTSRGEKKNTNIVDSTAVFAARTLRNGLMSGITSPSRDWFNLSLEDKALIEYGPVKQWLSTVTQLMSTALRRSNFYQVMPIVYGDLGVFGTGAVFVEEDFESIVRYYPMPIGSYLIANDAKLRVRVFMREMSMTVRQIVEKFGLERGSKEIDWTNISSVVRNLWERKEYEARITVRHCVQPNTNKDKSKLESKYKEFESLYYEVGLGNGKTTAGMNSQYSDEDKVKFLRHKGYDYFPVLVPRWEITGYDVWGSNCPGMTALGDNKQLQKSQRRKSEIIDKWARPPMVGSASLKKSKASILPGDTTYVGTREGEQIFRPAFQVDGRIDALTADIREIQQRIKTAYYEDLFLMMAHAGNQERRTATEVIEKKEEKLIALGSVYNRINNDMLDPNIEILFKLMLAQGKIPEPPPELQGANLNVTYVSVMAQAQKMLGLSGIERFSQFVNNSVAQTGVPTKKVDLDQMYDVYADGLGVDPSIIRSDELVLQMQEQEAAAAEAQAEREALAQSAKTAKDFSAVDLDKNTAATELAKGLGV